MNHQNLPRFTTTIVLCYMLINIVKDHIQRKRRLDTLYTLLEILFSFPEFFYSNVSQSNHSVDYC